MSLRISGLTKRFGGLTAVSDVSVTVEEGTIHAVIGPNGAGKTTLLNMLAGDLVPSAGSVAWRDEDITKLSASARVGRGIGRTYQRTALFTDKTVIMNVAMGELAETGGWRFLRPALDRPGLRGKALAALDRVGLAGMAEARAGVLSHGARRRVELAMVLIADPALLLLDEPLAGLGPDESRQVIEVIRALAPAHTVVLIEHDMDAIFSLSHALTVMDDGRMIATGTPKDVREDPAVRAAYLGEGPSVWGEEVP
ncbi:MAG: ABC transporter ATP-binding protein [Alphaproteobacteria bacterium]|nr:ABC transporter ATP-binding protein [Alphaproteobacteria bacterium]